MNKLGTSIELRVLMLTMLSHTVSSYTIWIRVRTIDFILTDHLGQWVGFIEDQEGLRPAHSNPHSSSKLFGFLTLFGYGLVMVTAPFMIMLAEH